jgi:hypothetical protein
MTPPPVIGPALRRISPVMQSLTAGGTVREVERELAAKIGRGAAQRLIREAKAQIALRGKYG